MPVLCCLLWSLCPHFLSPPPESRDLRTSGLFLGAQPEIRVTHHLCSSDSSSLSPVVEQEGEAYLEKVGGVRRHTVANAHTDVRLLSLSSRMNAEMDKGVMVKRVRGGVGFLVGDGPMTDRAFSSQPDIVETQRGGAVHVSSS